MDNGIAALIVDSQELFGAGLKSILAKDRSRIRARVATSFETALEALEADAQLQLAIIDIDAPGMAGACSTRLLRERYPALRIIVATARAHREEILECLSWRVHGVVVKTQPAREIASAVRIVMSGGIFVPPALCDRQRHAAIDVDAGHRVEPAATGEGVRSLLPGLADHPGGWVGAHLSARQAAVLRLLARGLSNKAIARELGLAEGTIKVHVNALFKALQVRNRASAVATWTASGSERTWHA